MSEGVVTKLQYTFEAETPKRWLQVLPLPGNRAVEFTEHRQLRCARETRKGEAQLSSLLRSTSVAVWLLTERNREPQGVKVNFFGCLRAKNLFSSPLPAGTSTTGRTAPT